MSSTNQLIFDAEYRADEWIYGTDPSSVCRVIERTEGLFGKVKDILDIGGGYGRDAAWLLKYLQASTTVVDISSVAIEQGKRFVEGVTFEQGDLIEYEFKSPCYDLICSYQVLHLFDMKSDLEAVFKNISKALKSGGRMIHMFISDKCNTPKTAHHYEIHKHKKEELEKLCENNNLKEVKTEYKYVLEYHHCKYHPHTMWLLMCNKT